MKLVLVPVNDNTDVKHNIVQRKIIDSESSLLDKLKNCRVQGKYAGQITDISRGTVFIRLFNGANAIAYACHDRRMPGKMDDVSFVVTRIDEEQGIAFGIITRIIKQNL